jgi:hypothetical protein
LEEYPDMPDLPKWKTPANKIDFKSIIDVVLDAGGSLSCTCIHALELSSFRKILFG